MIRNITRTCFIPFTPILERRMKRYANRNMSKRFIFGIDGGWAVSISFPVTTMPFGELNLRATSPSMSDEMIDDARHASGKLVEMPARIVDALAPMDEHEIFDFDSHLTDAK
jgi:hypothetical protein